ncbi:MAG: MFS transporter [Gordonibacter sp.]|nr:MFS transporter [Gordonibacter sp.]
MGEKSKTGNAWVNFVLIFIMGAIFAVGFFKVPPAMGSLMEYFQCGLGEAGWFMSACSVAGTVIAFVTGAIQTKIGPKGMLIAALVCMALDSLVGVLAPSVEVFIASRFIGGLGNGFLATAGPTLIALLFKDPAKRSLPNSIWACWTAAGSLIMLNAFAAILGATGSWQGVWWFCLAVNAIALVVAIFGIRINHTEEMTMVATGGDVKPWAGLTSLNSWLLVIIFACFAFIFSVWSAMAPTYLQTPLVGMDMAAANSVSSITTITGIVGSLIIGVVLSKIKNQPLVLVATMVLCTVAGIIQFIFTDQAMIVVVAVLVGLFTNIVPPALFSNAQWAAKTPAGVALVMAALPIGANFGGIPAAPIAGAIVESTGSWAMVAAPLGIVGALGLLCSIVFMIRCSKAAIEAGK